MSAADNKPKILIKQGRVICPQQELDQVKDLYIAEGKIAAYDSCADFTADFEIDASNKLLIPGIVDLCMSLDEPGQVNQTSIDCETRAANASGVTTLCCQPNTDPVIDTPASAELLQQHAKNKNFCRILPIGALTTKLSSEQLAEMHALHQAGCVAVSNGRYPICNTTLLRNAFLYAASLNLVIFYQAEDYYLGKDACAHEGLVAGRLGLPSIPSCAESIEIARVLELVADTGARVHFNKISTQAGLELIAKAKQSGLPVTADVSIQNLFLTEMDVVGFDSNCHVQPPLRDISCQHALRDALKSGIIDAICSDHQPREIEAKLLPFEQAKPGVSALETFLPLVLRLEQLDVLNLSEAINKITAAPGKILNRPLGNLAIDGVADVVIVDPHAAYMLDPAKLVSQGKNTPYAGWDFDAKVVNTIFAGNLID